MKVAFDMSAVLWTCLLVGKDTEGREVNFGDKKVWINSTDYGYEMTVNKIVAALSRFSCTPKDMLMVFEGKLSKKRRLMLDNTYKEGRDRAPEYYEVFQALRTRIQKTFHDLGATAVWQDYVEADDILAWLAKNTEEELVIVTTDGDLTPLFGKNKYGAEVHTLIGDWFDENKYGPFSEAHVPVYKALVGDPGDNIKGCVGFGAKAFEKFHQAYGEEGLGQLHNLMETNTLHALAEDVADPLVKKIFDQRDQVLKSYRVARLRSEWVDTPLEPLKWAPGLTLPAPAVKDERLEHWYGQKYLITRDKFERAVAWATPLLELTAYPGLDIETSTSDESDDWLAKQGKADGVDVIGSRLTGLSITFGDNLQYTMYFPVSHADTDNCSSSQVRDFILGLKKTWIIHNAGGFELPVLGREWGEGLKPSELFFSCLDTRIEANYVNENLSEYGLKYLSKLYLGYDQTNYDTVTKLQIDTDDTGEPILKQFKMNQLSGRHVLNYACDDTITCSALHNFFKLRMQLEHQYDVFLDVETDAAYLGAAGFMGGVPMSHRRLRELAAEDQAAHDKAWGYLRQFLIKQGWEGTVPPSYSPEIEASQIKEAYLIVTGQELKTMVRTPAKLVKMIRDEGHDLFAALLEQCLAGDAQRFTDYVRNHFKAEPEFKLSNKQMSYLLYDRMALPIRIRNKPTDIMRAEGRTEGNPKADALALAYALKFDANDETKPVLEALKEMQVAETRQKLFWHPYPLLVHWATGVLHPQIRQSATNTRRATGSSPNAQQVSKHEKIEGEGAPKVREVYVPHHRKAVVVSMDFNAQELREIAEYSRDANMVACYVGDNKKDIHALTGHRIALSRGGRFALWTYEDFEAARAAGDKEVKDLRSVLGKKVNFTTEYGAQALKVAQTLIVSEEEAQTFIDAKEAAFPDVRVWKDSVEDEARENGNVRTRLGAVRHLADSLNSQDRSESSKALRQAVNFKIQSSSAEQTKRACGAAWRAKLLDRFDCRFYFPVHDEVVWSCAIEDLFEFIPALHACMVQPYGENRLLPIVSSISFGKSFGPDDQIDIGEKPTREAIQEGLDEYYKRMGIREPA